MTKYEYQLTQPDDAIRQIVKVCRLTYSVDTTVPIGVINTALLGCKTHRISTVINNATGGKFTPHSKVYGLFTGSFFGTNLEHFDILAIYYDYNYDYGGY